MEPSTSNARKFIIAEPVTESPKEANFKIVTEPISDDLQPGEILAKAEWHTVDPYMRMAMIKLNPGDAIPGRQIAVIVKSKNEDYPEGTRVIGNFGWRDLTVYKPPAEVDYDNFYVLPDLKGLPLTYALGTVSRVGVTAYFGLLDILEPRQGQTLVVTAAAGAVGNLVGQIGKIKGCKVIAFVGADDKMEWLKGLGFDLVFNYRQVNVDQVLTEYVPEGVDLYFDNVGGEFSYHVMNHMNLYGRVALCGAISAYNRNRDEPLKVPINYENMIYKQLRIEAFVVSRWKHRWLEALHQLRDWTLLGKIQVRETIEEGFDNMPNAFFKLFESNTTGKIVIRSNPVPDASEDVKIIFGDKTKDLNQFI